MSPSSVDSMSDSTFVLVSGSIPARALLTLSISALAAAPPPSGRAERGGMRWWGRRSWRTAANGLEL
eukprot:CAMPEP_0182861432 /NCGR_PEP_ID=MMETSP0034_2-20130328/5492_1 /TAXON_ID=156128 /ORGANISM="Nephroselmis pyriformis, Strain CCMP717" /LENGTH=66 /DNA_ID=CAMNT_0024993363 /DNA_START=207 /DNA_END=404 /DNA_ORIENTATION=-